MKEIREKLKEDSTEKETEFEGIDVTLEKISSNGVNMEHMSKEKMEELF